MRHSFTQEHGFSMISTLASLVAVAVLGVLALGTLKSGTSTSASGGQSPAAAQAQAQDVQAKLILTTAQTAVGTYAASGDAGTPVTASGLESIEPTLGTPNAKTPYLSSASGTPAAYTLTAVDPVTGDSFTLSYSGGTVSHSCTTAGHGGCLAGGTW